MQEKREINTAIIAFGSPFCCSFWGGPDITGMILLRSALEIPGVRFRAVCNIWQYRLNYQYGTIRAETRGKADPKRFIHYADLLAAKDTLELEAVIIAVPPFLRAEIACAAMDAGLHIYLVPEIAMTPEDTHKIVETAAATGRVCQVGHHRRSNPLYLAAKRMIESGDCGEVLTCRTAWNAPPPPEICDFPAGERFKISEEVLRRYGLENKNSIPTRGCFGSTRSAFSHVAAPGRWTC